MLKSSHPLPKIPPRSVRYSIKKASKNLHRLVSCQPRELPFSLFIAAQFLSGSPMVRTSKGSSTCVTPFLRQYPRTEPGKTAQRRAFEERQAPELTPGGINRPPHSRPRPALRGGVHGPSGPFDPRPLSCYNFDQVKTSQEYPLVIHRLIQQFWYPRRVQR